MLLKFAMMGIWDQKSFKCPLLRTANRYATRNTSPFIAMQNVLSLYSLDISTVDVKDKAQSFYTQ